MKIKSRKSSSKSDEKAKLTYFQRFSLFFYDNKRFSLFTWLGLLILGFFTYTSFIQREGFPSVQVPISIVNANYFVDDKEKVDSAVAIPISDAIRSIPEVKEVATITTSNFTTATVTFDESTSSQDGSALVQQKLSSLELPEQAELTFRSIDASKYAFEYDMLGAIYSKEATTTSADQKVAAELLATKLNSLEGVASASVIPQIQIASDPTSGTQREVKSSFDILGLKGDNGQIEFFEATNVGIKLKEGQDLLEASSSIQKAIDEFSTTAEFQNFNATLSSDLAPIVRTQISSLQKSMLEGFLIVALISFILVSWRTGLATALTMLTVLLITVLILYLLGLTLNVISLFALILSLGLIVDDSTIIAESIDSLKDHSKDKREVVKEAIKRVARASTAGTLTTIFAFVPMLFISGILGGFIRAIPITIITSLALSLIVSLSLMPFFSRGFLLSSSKKKTKLNPVQKGEKWVADKLAKLLIYAGKNRKKGAFITLFFIILSLVATMVGGSYFSKAGFDIFAKEKDSNEIAVSITYRPGSQIDDALEQASRVNQIIATESDNIEQLTYSGSGTTQESSVSLVLVDLNKREDTSIQISERLQTQFDQLALKEGILASAASSGAGGAVSDFPLEVKVLGDDQQKAANLLLATQNKLEGNKLKTLSGKEFSVDKFLPADNASVIQRSDSVRSTSLRVGFSIDSSTEVIEATRVFIEENIKPESFGLSEEALVIDAGFEEDNQDSFNSMLVAFPIMIVAMYLLLLVQFKSFLQPLFIFLAIPFSFLGVGAGLYYTNNSASFFVMLGFFALIGISVNNTILITDFANQERAKGAGRVESIANALKARFRPLLTTSITSVVALIPLAISDPFWQSLSVTLIFGLLSSTLLVILCFPYYLIAAEALRSLARRVKRLLKLSRKKNK